MSCLEMIAVILEVIILPVEVDQWPRENEYSEASTKKDRTPCGEKGPEEIKVTLQIWRTKWTVKKPSIFPLTCCWELMDFLSFLHLEFFSVI